MGKTLVLGGRLWLRWREVGIGAAAFPFSLVASWELCAWAGHPHGGPDRWVICAAFAGFVAAAVAVVLHQDANRKEVRASGPEVESAVSGSIRVAGNGNRVAGPSAYENTFGDTGSGGPPGHGAAANTAPPAAQPAAPVPHESEPAADPGLDVDVRGSGNRVAGTGAHHNDFGDHGGDVGDYNGAPRR